jgi:hypothetical protein
MAEETEVPFGKTGISYYENMRDTVRNLPLSNRSVRRNETHLLTKPFVFLDQLRNTQPWVLRHPASAWQNRYSKNRAKFEEEIRKYKNNPRNFDLGEGGSRLPESQERLGNGGLLDGGMPHDQLPPELGGQVLESPITAGRMRLREGPDGVSPIGGSSCLLTFRPLILSIFSVRPPKRRRRMSRGSLTTPEDFKDIVYYAIGALAKEVGLRDEDVIKMYDPPGIRFVDTRGTCYNLLRIAEGCRLSVRDVCDMWFQLDKDMVRTAEYYEEFKERGGDLVPVAVSGPPIQPGLE